MANKSLEEFISRVDGAPIELIEAAEYGVDCEDGDVRQTCSNLVNAYYALLSLFDELEVELG